MRTHIEPIAALMNRFSKLPNVGQKTAMRYAYAVLNMPESDVADFARVMTEAREKVHFCSVCGTFTDADPCIICSRGDTSVVCVVKEPKDVVALTRISDYKGVFHVLHGTISPLDNRSPDDIRIKELVTRVGGGGIKEVILATNPDVQGEATAVYIARLLKPLGVKVTRIAQGISMGSELEFADEVTLSRALENRREI
jgi:recombination protein RecR